MMHKKTIILFSLLALAMNLYSQKALFDVQLIDHGLIREGATEKYTFTFTNTGKNTIQLSDKTVQSNCECVSVEFSKVPIPPGGKGEINAYMHTQGRVGAFSKMIYYTEGEDIIILLKLIGVIRAAEEPHVYTQEQLNASSNIKADRLSHNFGKVMKANNVNTFFEVTNTGKDTLKLEAVSGYINATYYLREKNSNNKEEIPYLLPGQTAELEIVYIASTLGKNTVYYILFTNSKITPVVTLTLNIDVIREY